MTEVTLPTPTPGALGEHAFHTASKTFIDEAGRDGAKVANKLGETISVLDHGAVGDNSTDDGASIVAAHTATVNAGEGSTLLFPAGFNFKTTAALTFSRLINVVMFSPITYHGAAGTPVVALTIGDATANATTRIYEIRVMRASQSDWTSEGDIGVKFINPSSCNIDINRAEAFTIPVQMIGDSTGCSYNRTTLGRLVGGKFQLDLTQRDGGWCNENVFFKGRISASGSLHPTLERFGVRITSQDGSSLNNNNNVFYAPSFEINADVAGGGVPVLIEHGLQNHFHDSRDESRGTHFARVLNASSLNHFGVGYIGEVAHDISRIDDQSSNPSSTTNPAGPGSLPKQAHRLIFKSPHLPKTWCYYDGATNINLPGLVVGWSTNGTISNRQDSITPAADHMEFPVTRYVGVYLDTRKVKRFALSTDADVGFGGRYLVACFDSTGTRLDDTDPGHPYAIASGGGTLTWNTGAGGTYLSTGDSNNPRAFVVGPDVASVLVGLRGGTAVMRLRSFAIHALEQGSVSTWTTFERANGLNQGSAAPTAGTWERGRRVLNDAPAAAGFEGWICVTAGTPGTWKGFGAIEA